jgi:mannose-1-phosphate guanylyltransferase
MDAVILAGGFGTRLKPLTYTKPKPLLPILNTPMIMRLLSTLPKFIKRVVIAANYRHEMLEKYLASQQLDVEVIVSKEPFPLGTGGATKYVERYIEGTFFVLNSDIISTIDLSALVEVHKRNNATVTIALWPVKDVSEYGVVKLAGERIYEFVEKPPQCTAPSNLINAGAYCLEEEVLKYIMPEKFVSMEREIFPKIIEDGKGFFGYKFEGYWVDVGRPENYIEAHQILMALNNMDCYTGLNCMINGKLIRTCVGNDVSVETGSVLANSIVLDSTRIGKNVNITDCIIGENVVIGDNASIKNSIIGDNERIEAHKKIQLARIWSKNIPAGYPK